MARTRLANLHTHIAKLPRVDTRQQGRRRNRSSSSSSIRISHSQLPVMREATHAPLLQKLRSRKATVRLAIIMHRPETVRKAEHRSRRGRRREGGVVVTAQAYTLSITCNEHNFCLAHSNIYGNFARRTKLKLNKSSFA